MTTALSIEARFAGPPGSGNGGYTAGRLAGLVGGRPANGWSGSPLTITLRRPPPLDEPLTISRVGDRTTMSHGEVLIAEAAPGAFATEPPSPVSVEAARQAQTAYPGMTAHPFPTCFVCGPDRRPGDGLLLAPGPTAPGRTACVWEPDPSLSTAAVDAAGDQRTDALAEQVSVEFVWAALDCPGGWTSNLDARPLVLGRMTASCVVAPRIGENYVVVGRLLETQGRKTRTATALYDAAGHLLARAEHIWIAIDSATFNTASPPDG